MRVLLVKPAPAAIDFGLAPFFQTEPLGLMYVAAALQQHGHSVEIVDLRFESRTIARVLHRGQPEVVGISCVHILDVRATEALASAVKEFSPGTTVIVGGHAASTYPSALEGCRSIDAIAAGEGERPMVAICDAIQHRRPLQSVPGLLVQDGPNGFSRTGDVPELLPLEDVPVPDRRGVARYQRAYCCVNYMPV